MELICNVSRLMLISISTLLGILDSLEARPSAPPSLGSLGSPSTDFLQCNNVDCSDQFTLEQEWRYLESSKYAHLRYIAHL